MATELGMNDGQLRLMGEVVVRATIIEALVATCISRVVEGGVEPDAPAELRERVDVLTDGQPAGWLLDRAERLTDELPPALGTELRDWLRQARAALEERNSLVHTLWFYEVHEGATLGLRKRRSGPVGRVVNIEHLEAARQQLEAAQSEGRRLAGILGGEPR